MQKNQSDNSIEQTTGKLFGGLWNNYNDKLFEDSVSLFNERLDLSRFDKHWFRDKVCLDAGCGGGRATIGMARLGAKKVIGVDVGGEGLENAKMRSSSLDNVEFKETSIIELPFKDNEFDMVWCSGVVHHTIDQYKALNEITRVTKIGGYVYLLVYATGGMRWPLIQLLRPLAKKIGQDLIDTAITKAKLPANKRRTFLDDLFVPKIDFYDYSRLCTALETRGLGNIKRWGIDCRLDHEQNLKSYRQDLESLLAIFSVNIKTLVDVEPYISQLFISGRNIIKSTIDVILTFENSVSRDEISLESAMNIVIGQGHHRIIATKVS
tara:strand:+ start:5584 stop:6552 length:969 start_codon:yes stop_codon:yes gene_type:complete